MARHRTTLAVLLGAAVPLAACSLTTSLDNLTGGLDDAGVRIVYVEAGSPATDATLLAHDAADDANDDDATIAIDAGTDASAGDAAVDSAPQDAGYDGPWCLGQPRHTLCSDFDESSLYFAYTDGSVQWGAVQYGSETVGLSAASTPPAPSPPAAFLSVLHPTDAGSQSGAQIGFPIPLTATSIAFHGDILYSQPTPLQSGQATVFTVSEVSGSNYAGANVLWNSTGIGLYNDIYAGDAGFVGNAHYNLPFSPVWQHYDFTITRHMPMGHITLIVDSVTMVDEDVQTVGTGVTGLNFNLGLSAVGSTPEIGAFFDNVTIDITD